MPEPEPANPQPPDIAGAKQQETATEETTTAISSPTNDQARQPGSPPSPNELLSSASGPCAPPPSQRNLQTAESLQNSTVTSPQKNLPSIQAIDGQSPQPHPSAQPTQAPIGSPLPSHMPPMGQYIAGYPPGIPQIRPSNSRAGYSMPGDASKMLSGGRHKKEIKRRTKTGCLTCRKRRIKVCIGMPVLCRRLVRLERGDKPGFSLAVTLAWPQACLRASRPPPTITPLSQCPTFVFHSVNFNISLVTDSD
jgi:hypothetical protein